MTQLANEKIPSPRANEQAPIVGAPDRRYTGDICYECRDPWCVGCEHADVARD